MISSLPLGRPSHHELNGLEQLLSSRNGTVQHAPPTRAELATTKTGCLKRPAPGRDRNAWLKDARTTCIRLIPPKNYPRAGLNKWFRVSPSVGFNGLGQLSLTLGAIQKVCNLTGGLSTRRMDATQKKGKTISPRTGSPSAPSDEA